MRRPPRRTSSLLAESIVTTRPRLFFLKAAQTISVKTPQAMVNNPDAQGRKMTSSRRPARLMIPGMLLLLVALLPLAVTRLTDASSTTSLSGRAVGQPEEVATGIGAALEPGLFFATFTVNSLGDTGAGSGTTGDLRYCITQANALGGTNTINFSVTGVITLASALPAISNNLTINGPGANALTISGNNSVRVFQTSSSPTVTFANLTIANGNAGGSFGGGIHHPGNSTINITNCVIRNCTAFLGGGVENENTGTINITNSTLTNNTAVGNHGGGVANIVGGTINVTGSTFSNNSVSTGGGNGGGIFNNDSGASRINLTNSTFSGNSAASVGGGLATLAGIHTVTNCTFTGNSAALGGGIYRSGGGSLQIKNSIVAQNSAGTGPDFFGAATSLGYNLIGNNSSASGFPAGSPNVNNDYAGTSVSPINAQLAPLADNGGPTKTHTLLGGSLALDHGSVATGVTTDQRGFARVFDDPAIAPSTGGNDSDIGAYEANAVPPLPCTNTSFSEAAGSPISLFADPISIVTADFNADNKLDLATANYSTNNVSILLGNGAGGFTPAAGSPISVGTTPRAIVKADFNLDGKVDLATANSVSSNVTILLGNGTGGFTQPTGSPFAVGPNPFSVAVGDFNLDGKPDLVTGDNSSASIHTLMGDGSGGFTPGASVVAGQYGNAVAVEDFNLDGKPDVAVALNNTAPDNAQVAILLGNGAGGFAHAAGSPIAWGVKPYTIVTGDFNLDGKPDLATGNYLSDNVTIRLGNGSGGFSLAPGSPIAAGDGAFGLAVGDINLDGKPDLAVTNLDAPSPNLRILLGNGTGGFTQPAGSPIGAGIGPYAVAMGDFNTDGKPDLAIANNFSFNVTIRLNACVGNSAPTITPQASVSRQQGSAVSNSQIATVTDNGGASGVTVTVTSANPSNGVTLSNIVNTNGMVTADIVATCAATNASFTLQASDGSLTSTATLNVTVNANTAPVLGNYPTTSVNLNGGTTVTPSAMPTDNGTITGITAAASPAGFTGTLSVNPSTGVVTVTNAAPAGVYMLTVTATDDCGAMSGKSFTLNVAPPTLGAYPNATVNLSGNSTVIADATPTAATSISASTTTKFKGILTANLTTGVVRVVNAYPAGIYTVTVKAFGAGGMTTKTFTLTVQGGTFCTATQSFVNAPNVPVNAFPHALALGDFNEDGHQDFAVGYASTDPVSLRFGNGAGGFSGTATVSTGLFIHSIAVGDFNEDGHQDFASGGNDGSLGVHIRLGDGTGNFSGTTLVPAGIHPISIAIGDFNNDGHQDFAAANNIDDNVAIRLGDGTGNFSGTTTVAVGNQPISVAIGDFNNDGNQDFAAGQEFTGGPGTGFVSVRLGNGLGGFTNAADVPVSIFPHCVVINDFNNDNIQDIAASGSSLTANMVSVRLGTGTGSFTGTTDVAVSSGPERMVTGDFNNDGNQDFATANVGFGTISLRYGNGAGGFPATSEISVGTNPRPLVVGDFNNDNRQDFAVVHFNNTTNFAAIRLNSCSTPPTISAVGITRTAGSPSANSTIANVSDSEDLEQNLTVTVNNATSATSSGVMVSNLTVDAMGVVKADVVAACGAANASFTLKVTDSSGLSNTATLSVTVNANTAPLLGDYSTTSVNAGGSTTVTPTAMPTDNGTITGITAAASPASFTGSFSVNPSTGVVTITNAAPQGVYTVTVTATDDCGATSNKMFTLNVTCPTITLAPVTLPNGTVGAAYNNPISASGGAAPYSFAVTMGSAPTGLTLNSNGTWSGSPSAANIFNFTVTATDANGCTGTRAYTVITIPTATLGTYGNAAINLSGNTTVAPSAAPTNAASLTAQTSTGFKGELDVDAMGVVRVTNAHPTGTYTVTVTAFNGAGATTTATFTLTVTATACNAFNFLAATSHAAAMIPNSVAVGDFNRDGKQDFATANQGLSNNVSVFLGDGAGGFSAAAHRPASGSPVSIAVGDFNGDGKEDLATANNSGTVSVFPGDGMGAFPIRTDSVTGGSPFQVAIGDFNNDGRQDIAVALNTAHAVAVLLNNGTGGPISFAAPVLTPVGNNPNALAIGDFNEDGKPDVVTTNDGSDNISILLGDGAGGFSVTSTSIGVRPSQVAIGDFNNDGNQDFVFAKYDLDRVTVWQGNGAGGFTVLGDFLSDGNLARPVAIGDFNGDGWQDLVIGNNESDEVSFLLNNGMGGFAPAVKFAVGDFPALIAVADFNSDGLQDIVTANQNSNDATVLLRICSLPPTISTVAVTRPADNTSANVTIANANDPEGALNTLTVMVNNATSATSNGVTVSNLTVDSMGVVKADVVAACGAANASFTLKVTDTSGLSNVTPPVITLNVTVTPDAIAPTLTCPANITQGTDANQCQAVVNYANATATDNCPNVGAPVCTPSSGTAFPKGTTTVNCTVSDAAGNQASCSFTVTINDTQDPTITCPPSQTVNTDANQCQAVVNYSPPTAADNCAGVGTPSCNPPSGSVFPKGTTMVNCQVSDAAGRTATCSFTITVNDTQNPTITCPQNQTVTTANACEVVNYPTPTVADNCALPINAVICNPPSGFCFPAGPGGTPGVTTVNCTVTDASNNQASCSFTVTVIPCTITCPQNVTTSTDPNQCQAVVNYPPPTTQGGCGTITCTPPSGSAFPKGATTVNCTTQTGPTCSFTVTVNDAEKPVLICPTSITQPTDKGACEAQVTYPNATATDNCAGVGTPSCSPPSGSTFPKGTTTVNCQVSDASGNSASGSFTVTINDQQSPSIICPANITQPAPQGQCEATVKYAPPQVTDNCAGVGTPVCTPPSGSTFQRGTTTVNCSVTDAAGNPASCSFTVTVTDTQNPTISCPANITTPTDAGQCAAVETFAPQASDNCPNVAVVCAPPSGSAFPKGTTTVNCTATDSSGNTAACAFTVTVIDQQSPTLSCPADIVTSAAASCPAAAGSPVTYATPTAADNCAVASVVCSPPSGSTFPTGTTTVNCVATDTSGNTASCTFRVRVYDLCLQDNSNPGVVLLINTLTGDYAFCYAGTTYTGTGTITKRGCQVTLQHNTTSRRVTASIQLGTTPRSGTASLQAPAGTTLCTITDSNLANNSCACAFNF